MDVVDATRRAIPASVPAAACGLAAGALCLYALSLPHALFGIHWFTGGGYDDAVYLGSSLRLLDGVLPYRDYAFVQPPGIAVLLAPFAGLAHLVGSRVALGTARLFGALVAGTNAALAALVLRHRGPGAMLVSGGLVALFPLAGAADFTVELEPYLVLFCLVGLLVATRDGALASSRRLAWAGLCLGFGGAIKLWAVFPAIALVVVAARVSPRRAVAAAGGSALGFLLVCAPFAAASPARFFHDVVVDQLGRPRGGAGGVGLAGRVELLTGIAGVPALDPSALLGALIGAVVVVLVLVGYLRGRRRVAAGDVVVLLSAVLASAALLLAPVLYDHYTYFSTAFLALALGEAIGLAPRPAAGRPSRGRRVAASLAASLGLALAGALAVGDVTYARAQLSAATDPGPRLAAAIPAGSCVLFDDPALAIAADRFVPSGSGCPALVDPLGVWLAESPTPEVPPAPRPYNAAVVASWSAWIARADFVLLRVPDSDYLPFTESIPAEFATRFRLVRVFYRCYVYEAAR